MVTSGVEIVDYGTDKDTYHRGDNVRAFIRIKNNGDATIENAIVKISVAKHIPLVGFMHVYSTDYPLNGLSIRPGETKMIEATEKIPTEVAGISTKGKYEFKIKVMVDHEEIADFTKAITVQ